VQVYALEAEIFLHASHLSGTLVIKPILRGLSRKIDPGKTGLARPIMDAKTGPDQNWSGWTTFLVTKIGPT